MNKMSIKLFCIFVMIMYCLAPLSAIDLNQDNNNTLKELNDTSNDTIDDASNEEEKNVEIKEINNTDIATSNSTIDKNNREIEILEVNETVNDKKLGDVIPDISVTIPDINYGEKPTVTIYAQYRIYTTEWKAEYINPLKISCPQFSHDYHFTLDGDGFYYMKESYSLDENLEPGIYTVIASYPGGKNLKPWSCEYKFQVKRNSEPNMRLKIDNITYGKKLNVKFDADEELNGTIHLKINDGRIHTFQVRNGVGETSISGLDPGTYNATATFDGNYLFKKGVASTTFTVKGNDNPKALLNLHVDNIKLGEDAKLQIKSQDTFDDNVKIQIKGADGTKEMTVHVTGGVGETTIPDLKIGNYAAVAIFDGNDKFRPSENATTFTVNKQDPNMKIHVDDTSYGENAIIKIKANETFNSNVKVNLKGENDSKTVMVNVKDGVGDASVANLMPETYSVDATFDGNDTCNSDYASTSFNVEKAATDLSITTENIGTMSKLVKIHTKKIFSGDIKLKLKSENDYQEVTIKVVDGVGETTLSGLIPFDTYNATATFDGNEFFKPGSASTTFKIQGRL